MFPDESQVFFELLSRGSKDFAHVLMTSVLYVSTQINDKLEMPPTLLYVIIVANISRGSMLPIQFNILLNVCQVSIDLLYLLSPLYWVNLAIKDLVFFFFLHVVRQLLVLILRRIEKIDLCLLDITAYHFPFDFTFVAWTLLNLSCLDLPIN